MVIVKGFEISPSYRSAWITTGLNPNTDNSQYIGQDVDVYTGSDLIVDPSALGGRWFGRRKKSKKSKKKKVKGKKKNSKKSKKSVKKTRSFGVSRVLTPGGLGTQDSWKI